MKRKTIVFNLTARIMFLLVGLVTANWVAVLLAIFMPIGIPASYILGFTESEEKELEGIIAKSLKTVADKNSEAIKQAVKTEMEVTVAGLIKADEFASKLESLGLKDGAIKELFDAVTKQGEQLRKIFAGKQTEGKTLEEYVDEKAADIINVAKNGGRLRMEISQKSLVQRSSVSSSTMAMRLTDIGQLPYQGTVFSSLFRHVTVGANSNGVIRYVDQNTITRSAAPVSEGAQKPESAITWVERSIPVEKIADSIPVTREMMADVGFVRGELDRLLNINLALKEDQQLYSGTGVTPQLKGLTVSAGNFNAGAYAGFKPSSPTLYDLMAILKVEITNGKQSKYNPNVVVLNPADALRFKLAKGTNGHYVLPPFILENGGSVDGMTIVESSQVTPNTLIVGDFRYGTIYDLEGITIDMGFIDKQFIENTMTILAEKRECLLIRVVDEDAFLECTDIDAALAAITAV